MRPVYFSVILSPRYGLSSCNYILIPRSCAARAPRRVARFSAAHPFSPFPTKLFLSFVAPLSLLLSSSRPSFFAVLSSHPPLFSAPRSSPLGQGSSGRLSRMLIHPPLRLSLSLSPSFFRPNIDLARDHASPSDHPTPSVTFLLLPVLDQFVLPYRLSYNSAQIENYRLCSPPPALHSLYFTGRSIGCHFGILT